MWSEAWGMGKPKSKRKLRPFGDVLSWLFVQPIDFISPLSLDECVERLEAQAGGSWLFGVKTDIDVVSVDEERRFRICKSGNRRLSVEAKGHLTTWDGTATRITGIARFTDMSYVIFALVALGWLLGLPQMYSRSSFGAGVFVLLFIFALSVSWLVTVYQRNSLVRWMTDILDPRKHKGG